MRIIYVLLIIILFVRCDSGSPVITNSIGIRMVKINPGHFIMGSDSGEFDERPVRNVQISKSFYISATPITNAQYEQFDPSHNSLRGERGFSSNDNEAVVFITWEEADAFAKWLSEKEGKKYRLPTEAEWEYVCRAGTTTTYSTGDSLPVDYYLNQEKEWYPKPVSLEVGKSEPNQWGICNMHGLVEEYCMDWYGSYSQNDIEDPVGYKTGDYKVTRGGSHNTELSYLSSSNRAGMLPDDKNCLVGFRVVLADYPKTTPIEITKIPNWAKDVSQERYQWGKCKEEPFFEKPIYFQNVPENMNGPLYSKHNHCPDINPLPNGDLFATWYTTNEEQGRELTVVASRLKKGENKWSEPELFFKVPDRNMHATSIFWDRSNNNFYHFQGVGVGMGWGDLALFLKKSTDNGVTWSSPQWINKEHGLRNMPIANVKKTSTNYLIVPCDAVTGGEGGSAIHISNDDGKTWIEPGRGTDKPTFEDGTKGGTIAGIHAGVVELRNGNLMALGRGNSINGYMPKSISADMGKSWTYSSSGLPPISNGQRLVLMRLQEGPLLLVSFTDIPNGTKGLPFKSKDGKTLIGYGLYAALSYDEGETWPVKKLITPGESEFDGGAWTSLFKTDKTHAEPRGYMAATQSPDGVIHLISSKLHYRFNPAWILQPND